jgi:hypothetical protein
MEGEAMSTTTWIRADADFGDPTLVLVLSGRDAVADQRIRRLLGQQSPPYNLNSEGMVKLAEELTRLVEEKRPDLRGLTLLSVAFKHAPASWEFLVVHPSLARHLPFEIPRQRLETCWTCGKPLSAEPDSMRWMRHLSAVETLYPQVKLLDAQKEIVDRWAPDLGPGSIVEVCSEECVTAKRIDPYRDPFSGKWLTTIGVAARQLLKNEQMTDPGEATIDGGSPLRNETPDGDGACGPTEFEKAWEAATEHHSRRVNEVVEQTTIGVKTNGDLKKAAKRVMDLDEIIQSHIAKRE